MSLEGTGNQFGGELAALKSRREMESLTVSPASSVLGKIAEFCDKFGIRGAGLFASALKSGQTPVEKVVEQLESGAYAEIARIGKHLEGQDVQLVEFGVQLKSVKAEAAYVAAILHGLRTSDPRKQSRIGALTVNCVYTNDTEPESLDDTMRAAVELNGQDIALLEELYERQPRMDMKETEKGRFDWYERMGSVAKLQAVAFAQLRTPGTDDGASILILLPMGKKFCERLQEISKENRG